MRKNVNKYFYGIDEILLKRKDFTEFPKRSSGHFRMHLKLYILEDVTASDR